MISFAYKGFATASSVSFLQREELADVVEFANTLWQFSNGCVIVLSLMDGLTSGTESIFRHFVRRGWMIRREPRFGVL